MRPKNHKINCQCCICKTIRREFKHSLKVKLLMSCQRKGKNNPAYKNGLSKCIDCGKELRRYKIGRCWDCYCKWIKNPENNPMYRIKLIGKNNHFYGKHHNVKTRKLLSNKAKLRYNLYPQLRKYLSKLRIKLKLSKGKNNPNWQGGISEEGYSYKFNNNLKESIRKRDNYQCQLCRVKQKDYYRKLDVHHIDYDKRNCRKDNLITLCKECNVKANTNRGYWYAYFKYIMENYKSIDIERSKLCQCTNH